MLEEFVEKRRRFIRDADDLVRGLTVEFEIELGPGSAVIPVGEMFEITPPQRALRERGASDGEADTRCLLGEAVLLRDRFDGSDNTACNEALSALALARENENGVAFGDMLTAIHRLLRGQRERLRSWIDNLGFDRERHAFPLVNTYDFEHGCIRNRHSVLSRRRRDTFEAASRHDAEYRRTIARERLIAKNGLSRLTPGGLWRRPVRFSSRPSQAG